jgi:hypothetical protein
MQYILDICGNANITDPMDNEIRKAVLDLDTGKGEAFVILCPSKDKTTYMKTSGDQHIGFTLEYQSSGAISQWRSTGEWNTERTIAALIAYRNGDEYWSRVNNWERTKW